MKKPEETNLSKEYLRWAQHASLSHPAMKYLSCQLKYRKHLEDRLLELEQLTESIGDPRCQHYDLEYSKEKYYIRCKDCGRIGRIIRKS